MWLERIEGPQDLKHLTAGQLEQLAQEIREELVRTVACNGGHLAANLGVVELTIALHRVFDSPRDKIIWDVGHQCYVHKLLTGRRREFASLRRYGGLSGFPKREESPHDSFNTGHSSTSISAALGLALARDLRGDHFEVVAVIGDGAMTAGMAFEAMNHAGHLRTHLIVVLNDNERSIENSVGAMAAYLARLRASTTYARSKERFKEMLRSWSPAGSKVLKVAERLKGSLKYLVVPGMVFEELGFTYLGPVDGHDLEALQEVLSWARRIEGPVLVHVLTQKGKGYPPAENSPEVFHGIGPFDPASGRPKDQSPVPSYSAVFGQTLVRLAEEDSRIVAITAAMTGGTGLEEFARRFPQRFFDVGIAEQHAVTLAAGLACAGLRPVVAVYSTFLQRAYDQVVHDVCLQRLPVVLAVDRAGLVGEDGETHQGVFDLAYLRHIPQIAVMAPKDEAELQHLLLTALELGGPAALRYPRGRGRGVGLATRPWPLPVGRGELLREGRHLVIAAIGPLVYEALKAAELLSARGIEVAVINARFVKPLDRELIVEQVRRTGYLLTVEEHVLAGGFGSAVLELLAAEGIRPNGVRCLGISDCFVSHGRPDELRAELGLDARGIAAAAEAMLRPGYACAGWG
ncbi:MAG: 1-deoxy-D-xylulose-5-phosphate synthase [Moorellales bacterium]